MSQGSVYPYCWCKDPATSKPYRRGKDPAGRFWSDCPDWDRRGHKRWGFAIDLGKVFDEAKQRHVRQQLRREGFTHPAPPPENALADEQPAIRIRHGTEPRPTGA